METKKDVEKKIRNVKRFIRDHKPDLTIYRVPSKTLEGFKAFARDEFADDYGMALKFLFDYAFNKSRMDTKIDQIMIEIGELKNRVNSLESSPKIIKSVGGRVIKKR